MCVFKSCNLTYLTQIYQFKNSCWLHIFLKYFMALILKIQTIFLKYFQRNKYLDTLQYKKIGLVYQVKNIFKKGTI